MILTGVRDGATIAKGSKVILTCSTFLRQNEELENIMFYWRVNDEEVTDFDTFSISDQLVAKLFFKPEEGENVIVCGTHNENASVHFQVDQPQELVKLQFRVRSDDHRKIVWIPFDATNIERSKVDLENLYEEISPSLRNKMSRLGSKDQIHGVDLQPPITLALHQEYNSGERSYNCPNIVIWILFCLRLQNT